jgi:UDPglucose 6-dehydrogenase
MELCEKTGADVDDLIDALQLGTRRIVSGSYMRAGMGDGGGCHPRDNIALSHIAKKLNISYDWWENLMIAREEQTKWLASLIAEKVYEIERNGKTIQTMILGYTFKPETNLIVGSPAILLQNVLETIWGIHPIMFDPFIDDINIFEEHPDSVNKDSLLHIICEPRIFFIGTKHEVFKNYIFPAGSIVIDPFRYIPDQDGVFIKRIGQENNKL